jgi:hypothetical protein
MFLLQATIVGAVMIHNEYHHWTPNKVAAGIIGFAFAYGATLVIFEVRQLWRRRRRPIRR